MVAAIIDRPWNLWFIQLSGWPVFLLVVAVVVAFMVAMSVVMTWISNRSIIQNMLLAFFAIALVGFGLLAVAAILSRLFVED